MILHSGRLQRGLPFDYHLELGFPIAASSELGCCWRKEACPADGRRGTFGTLQKLTSHQTQAEFFREDIALVTIMDCMVTGCIDCLSRYECPCIWQIMLYPSTKDMAEASGLFLLALDQKIGVYTLRVQPSPFDRLG
jgi:hypothetical protein